MVGLGKCHFTEIWFASYHLLRPVLFLHFSNVQNNSLIITAEVARRWLDGEIRRSLQINTTFMHSCWAQAKNKQFVQLHSRRQPLPMAGTLLCNASSASAFLARTSSSKTSLSLPLKPLALRSFSPSSRTGFFRIYALTSNDIKVGTNIEVDGAPWRVLEFLHVKPGKGAAFVRTKIRNYVTGNTVEKTFRAGSSLEEANVYKEVKQFTYKDGSQFVFMDLNTYEEIRLNAADVGDRTKWLKEGMDCIVLFWNGKVIDFEVPITIQLTVVDVDPGLKGDTAQGGSKPATLETGAVVSVPLFINVGDSIVIDTRTGQYTSRA